MASKGARIRLSQGAKEQLVQLKKTTGLTQWNELSRWALCCSLSDPSPPSRVAVVGDSSIEMTWRTFGGEIAELFQALVRERCKEDGLGVDASVVNEQVRLHLHRGIGMLAGKKIRGIADLTSMAGRSDDSE